MSALSDSYYNESADNAVEVQCERYAQRGCCTVSD